MKDLLKNTIFSDGSANFVSNPDPKLYETADFSIRLSKDVSVEKIYFVACPKGEVFYYKMDKWKDDDFFSYYKTSFKMVSKKLIYKFYLIVDKKEYFYTPYGLFDYEVPDNFSFTIFADADYSKWTPESVFYQIFPDRFNRVGESVFDDKDYELKVGDKIYKTKRVLCDWDEPLDTKHSHEKKIQFYGGNFNGVKEKIPYLKELGITAIYFTPIFKARSNHRYDIEDYLAPDPLLGTEEELADMIKTAHENGIKIIFDAVLNHTGVHHKWFDMFNEHKQNGAFICENSPYKEYYHFNKHPDNYESWMDCKILPQLNLANKEVRDSLLNNEDSAVKKWLKPPFSIDGWRMDTASILGKFPAEQIDIEFSKELHKAIKSENKDALIMGETFYDPKQLVDIDRYESTMNYRCSMSPLKKWLTGIVNFMSVPRGDENQNIVFSAKNALAQMKNARVGLTFQNQIRMYNLLNSHDTARFWTVLKKNYDKLKIALTVLFTYTGIPAFYYGDEVGMEGENDPDCRRPMIWDEKKRDKKINKLYKDLIDLRKKNKTLVYGSLLELFEEQNVLSFSRFLDNDTFIIVCNGDDTGKEITIDLRSIGLKNCELKDFYTDKKYFVSNSSLKINLSGFESLILRKV
ncbi:MAG TPA: alpha amylase N-terminal ig-like domain-containing protein [Spirochaetota bacterium]|nr:alpha amylase N-terminal ig-like domain-containing protein [Spirochaetota bacterium]